MAVLAAIADTSIAERAWRDLLAETDFIDISRSTQRLAPMVFLNLKNLQDVPERGRLRGSYKYAWSKNHNMIAAVAPVVSELEFQGINYRIVKGVAIQLALGIVGARVVGDLDLVVSRLDAGVVRAVLEKNGFRCNSVSACGLHPPRAVHNALDFNKGDAHVDMHVAELKEPSSLLKEMLKVLPHRVTYAGLTFLIPPPELLALHSASHGRAAVSETDFSQSVADIGLLMTMSDTDALTRYASRTGLSEDLWSLGETLALIGKSDLRVAQPKPSRRSIAAPEIVHRGSSFFSKAQYAVALWRERFHGGGPIWAAIRRFSGRKVPYILWSIVGQFSSLERRVFARREGFLRVPSQPLQGNESFQPFLEASKTVTVNVVARDCFDYRFSFRLPRGVRELVVTFEGRCLDDVDVTVHHNGLRMMRMVAGSSERRLAVLNPPEGNEISIRPISLACQTCFDALETLGVSISYRRGN